MPKVETEHRIEFDGSIQGLADALEDLIFPEDGPPRGRYWVEAGPFMVGGKDQDHSYFQTIVVDDENDRIYLDSA